MSLWHADKGLHPFLSYNHKLYRLGQKKNKKTARKKKHVEHFSHIFVRSNLSLRNAEYRYQCLLQYSKGVKYEIFLFDSCLFMQVFATFFPMNSKIIFFLIATMYSLSDADDGKCHTYGATDRFPVFCAAKFCEYIHMST